MSIVDVKEKPSELIGRFIELRNGRKAADETYAAFRKVEYDEPMNEIEMKLLDMLNEMGSDSIKAPTGTAFKKLSTSVTTADGAAFRRHVIGGELWDLIEFRPAKTAINNLIDEGEELPPGLNRTTFYNINVRKPGKSS